MLELTGVILILIGFLIISICVWQIKYQGIKWEIIDIILSIFSHDFFDNSIGVGLIGIGLVVVGFVFLFSGH